MWFDGLSDTANLFPNQTAALYTEKRGCSEKKKKSTITDRVIIFFVGQRQDERKAYEQQECTDNPLRCPVKLYEFYLSKW